MANLNFNLDEILPRANALFDAHCSESGAVVGAKIEELRNYDVSAMDRVAAICCTGSSGSLLLASYLDGHDDVLMLPKLCGWRIYEFLELHESLPLRDKLIAYPLFGQNWFEDDFPISPTRYFSAVEAILALNQGQSPEFLSSRRSFFLFLHIAYNMALGRRPASPHPLIVYAQHSRNDVFAARLVEDFPRAKFIHSIRDPITIYDRTFEHRLATLESRLPGGSTIYRTHLSIPLPKSRVASASKKPANPLRRLYLGIRSQINKDRPSPINRDRPHVGMESRTLAIRFEDLQRDTPQTIYNLCSWLGLSRQPALLNSTFNGSPYVVERSGRVWSGKRESQAERKMRYVSRTDRALLFAVFYENFVSWDYPCPKILRNSIVRSTVFLSVLPIPTKFEIAVAQVLFRRRILPAVRDGNIAILFRYLLLVLFHRVAVMAVFVLEFLARRLRGKTLLELCPRAP